MLEHLKNAHGQDSDEWEEFMLSAKPDSSKNTESYETLRENSLRTFKIKHLLIPTEEASKFRIDLANKLYKIMMKTRKNLVIKGFDFSDYKEYFDDHMTALGSWRMQKLFRDKKFMDTNGNSCKC